MHIRLVDGERINRIFKRFKRQIIVFITTAAY